MDGNPARFKPYILKREADAPDGDSHPRTAAASAAAPKLVRKTYLGDPSLSHAVAPPVQGGSRWAMKLHDFGKQWMEATWGKSESRPGKRGRTGRSPSPERNRQRAQARAKGEIRRKCIAIGADHLVTLTYRANVQGRTRVLEDLERLRRMLSRAGAAIPYVTVLECQKRGAIHPHIAVRGFQDVRLLRRCWYKIVGNGEGQVNVKGPRPGSSPVKLARYLSKYMSKDLEALPRTVGEHRYFCSLGINVPTERFEITLARPSEGVKGELVSLMLKEAVRRLGVHCNIMQWLGEGGACGWIAGYEDRSYRWFVGPIEPIEGSPVPVP